MKSNTQELAQALRVIGNILTDSIVSNDGVLESVIAAVADRVEVLQSERDKLSSRVDQFRAAAQPIVDDYFDWLESKQIDISEMSDSYVRIYDRMVNLKTALSEESK